MCIQTPALGSESICTWIQTTPLLQIRLLWDGGGVWCREEDQSTQRPGGCRQCGSTSGGLPQNQVGAVLLSSFQRDFIETSLGRRRRIGCVETLVFLEYECKNIIIYCVFVLILNHITQ